MEKEKFKKFKELYLDKFRCYYKDKETNKKKLKESVFSNIKLTNIQKRRFWELITK